MIVPKSKSSRGSANAVTLLLVGIIALIIGAAGAYLYTGKQSYQKGYDQGMLDALAKQTVQEVPATGGAAVPETNPFAAPEVNPFAEVKLNPFAR